ncbi:MAG: ZIP family metal transporter [Candidatus Altiarchaeota archaeon]
MNTLLWILGLTFINGLVAFVGALTLLLSEKMLRRMLYLFVAFSAGALMGGGLLHLLAKSLTVLSADTALILLLCGFSLFFLLERVLKWHHCHEKVCDVHAYSYLVLFGDGIHNFIDGLVIAAAFLTDTHLGIVTSFLIIAHEIPQELGDFGVLLNAGMTKTKALVYNFLSQLTCVLGGVVGFFLPSEGFKTLMLPIAAGGFLYIAASDLVPELHKETNIGKSMTAFLFFLAGVGLMAAVKIIAEGS